MEKLENILRIDKKIDWLPPGAELRITANGTPAPLNLTTSVHGLCFLDNRILMVDDKENKGWNIPGGHIEKCESLEEALRREIHEEAAASVEFIKPVGYFHVRFDGPEPPNIPGPYPDGYMQFCFCRVHSLNTFKSDYETFARKLFSPAEARQLDWVKNWPELYEIGLKEALRYA